jgi:RNA polymerase primary sigma factor
MAMQTATRTNRAAGLFQTAHRQGVAGPSAGLAPLAAEAEIEPALPASLTAYLGEIGQVQLLTAEEEIRLAQRIEQHDPLALRQLTQANLRLVVGIAKRYVNQGLDLLDLIQEGNLGLLKAVTRYDWRRGHRFATYASWWIRQAITHALTQQSRTVRLPARMTETVRRVRRLQRELTQALGRPATVEEVATTAAMRPAQVRFALMVAQPPISLDMPMTEEGEGDLGTMLEDTTIASLEEQVTEHLTAAELSQALQELPPRIYQVLALRFGLDGGEPHTLAETGALIGVGRERARQIERQALQALRQRLEGAVPPVLSEGSLSSLPLSAD